MTQRLEERERELGIKPDPVVEAYMKAMEQVLQGTAVVLFIVLQGTAMGYCHGTGSMQGSTRYYMMAGRLLAASTGCWRACKGRAWHGLAGWVGAARASPLVSA